MICPIKCTVYGPVHSMLDLKKAISRSGQPFGVDWSGPACNVNPAWPCDQTYYQHLGFGLHKGIDIPVSTGTEIYAMADGKVVEISDNATKGIGVVLFHQQLKLKSVYWHLQSHVVQLSDEVKEGQLIALSDNTGFSLGPHLHCQLNLTDDYGVSLNKSVDPIPYIEFKEIMLDKEDIKFLQALEGFHDEIGIDFWGDGTHNIKEYKNARIPDKIKELQNI